MTDRCSECGAAIDLRSCEELFHRLLALDHQDEQPWASFHALNVACYALQHASTTKPRHLAAQQWNSPKAVRLRGHPRSFA